MTRTRLDRFRSWVAFLAMMLTFFAFFVLAASAFIVLPLAMYHRDDYAVWLASRIILWSLAWIVIAVYLAPTFERWSHL